MWVGLVSSAEREQKDWIRRNAPCPASLHWDMGSSTVSELKWRHWRFLSLQPVSFQTGTYTLSSPGSQACRLKLELYHWFAWVLVYSLPILGLPGLHNQVSQFLITKPFCALACSLSLSLSLSLYIYIHTHTHTLTYILFLPFLWES